MLQLLNDDKDNTSHIISAILKQQSSASINIKLILNQFIEDIDDEETLKELLSTLSPPTASINQPLVNIFLKLSDIYTRKFEQSQQTIHLATSTDYLQQINLDLLINDYANDLEYQLFKVKINLKIVNNLYNLGKFEDCEAYLSRIFNSLSYYNTSNDPEYRQMFIESNKISIKILIQLNKWLEAATKLTNLKNFTTLDDYESTLIIIISLLAKHTTYKVNFIKETFRNETNLISIINTPLLSIFNKFVQFQIIYADEYQESLQYILSWATSNSRHNIRIQPEQIAKSYLIAILQQNLISVSKVYGNITFSNFKLILGITTKEYDELLEKTISDLVIDGYLSAAIDDVDEVIEFSSSNTNEPDDPLNQWNKHIVDSCQKLDEIVDEIEFKYPHLALGREESAAVNY